MGKWTKLFRGAIGIGLVWAGAWFTAGLGRMLVVGPDASDVPLPLGFALLGFLAGLTFSGILVLAEGCRRVDQPSMPRVAAWGAGGGLVFSGISQRLQRWVLEPYWCWHRFSRSQVPFARVDRLRWPGVVTLTLVCWRPRMPFRKPRILRIGCTGMNSTRFWYCST